MKKLAILVPRGMRKSVFSVGYRKLDFGILRWNSMARSKNEEIGRLKLERRITLPYWNHLLPTYPHHLVPRPHC
jgi:hypothetical protein